MAGGIVSCGSGHGGKGCVSHTGWKQCGCPTCFTIFTADGRFYLPTSAASSPPRWQTPTGRGNPGMLACSISPRLSGGFGSSPVYPVIWDIALCDGSGTATDTYTTQDVNPAVISPVCPNMNPAFWARTSGTNAISYVLGKDPALDSYCATCPTSGGRGPSSVVATLYGTAANPFGVSYDGAYTLPFGTTGTAADGDTYYGTGVIATGQTAYASLGCHPWEKTSTNVNALSVFGADSPTQTAWGQALPSPRWNFTILTFNDSQPGIAIAYPMSLRAPNPLTGALSVYWFSYNASGGIYINASGIIPGATLTVT